MQLANVRQRAEQQQYQLSSQAAELAAQLEEARKDAAATRSLAERLEQARAALACLPAAPRLGCRCPCLPCTPCLPLTSVLSRRGSAYPPARSASLCAWNARCCLPMFQAQKDASAAKADLQAQLAAAAGERDRLQQRSSQLETEVSVRA